VEKYKPLESHWESILITILYYFIKSFHHIGVNLMFNVQCCCERVWTVGVL